MMGYRVIWRDARHEHTFANRTGNRPHLGRWCGDADDFNSAMRLANRSADTLIDGEEDRIEIHEVDTRGFRNKLVLTLIKRT